MEKKFRSTGRVASRTPSPASTPLMLPALPPSYASRKPVPSGQRRHSTSAIFIDIEHGLGGITEALTYIHSLDVPGISAILCPPRWVAFGCTACCRPSVGGTAYKFLWFSNLSQVSTWRSCCPGQVVGCRSSCGLQLDPFFRYTHMVAGRLIHRGMIAKVFLCEVVCWNFSAIEALILLYQTSKIGHL